MIGWSDIFDFNDEKEVQKAIKGFDKISKTYEDFIKGSSTLASQYEKNLASMAQSAKEFEKAVSGISPATEKGRTQLSQMSKQAEVSGAQYDQMKKKMQALESTISSLKEEQRKFNESKSETTKKNSQLIKLQNKLNSLSTEEAKKIAETKLAIQQKNKELKDSARETAEVTSLYQKESATLRRLRNEYKDMALQYGKNSKKVQEKQKEVVELDNKLKSLDASVGQHQRNVGNYGEALDGLGINISKFLSPAGLMMGALAGTGLAMNELRKEIQATLKYMKETEKLTGETGLALEQLTAGIKTTSDVFNKEYTEVLQATNTVMKQFGVTGEEAIDIINEGFVRGFDINGDYLEQLKEYSVFFDEAGLSARTLMNVIGQSVQQGIFSDKGVDAIKEASIRIREMTPATRDAINAIGLSSDQIMSELENGSKSVFDVIQEVSGAMAELPPQSAKVGTAIADIFGGAGEDAGLKFLLTLKDIKTTQEGVNSSLTDYQKNQLEVLKVTEEYNTELVALSTNFDGFAGQFDLFIANVKNTSLSILNDLLTSFTSLDSQIGNFKKTVSQTTSISALEKELKKINEEIEKGKEDGFQKWSDVLKGAFLGVGGTAKATGDRIAGLYSKKKILEDQIKQLANAQDEQTKTTEKNTSATQANTSAKEKSAKAVKEVKDEVMDETEMYDYLNWLVKDLAKNQDISADMAEESARRRREASDRAFNQIAENLRREMELTKQAEEQKRQDYIDTAYAGVDIVNSLFDRRIQAIDQEMQALEEKTQRELELAEGNEEGQEIIRQRAKEREEQLMDEMAEKRRQQAIFNKAVAIAEIGINTALGIMKTIGQLGLPAALPFVIATGVLGAAQIGAVLAEPIPAYETGTDFAKGGASIVGEAGHELILRPDGKVEVSGDGPEVRDIPRGSKVIPADETEKILSQSKRQKETALQIDKGIGRERSQLVTPEIKQFLTRENDAIVEGFNRAISNLEIHNLYIEDGDLKRSIRKGNTTLKNVNKKYKFKS